MQIARHTEQRTYIKAHGLPETRIQSFPEDWSKGLSCRLKVPREMCCRSTRLLEHPRRIIERSRQSGQRASDPRGVVQNKPGWSFGTKGKQERHSVDSHEHRVDGNSDHLLYGRLQQGESGWMTGRNGEILSPVLLLVGSWIWSFSLAAKGGNVILSRRHVTWISDPWLQCHLRFELCHVLSCTHELSRIE